MKLRSVWMEEEEARLRPLGYRVHDLGAEFGSSYAGQFRWVHLPTATFGEIQPTEFAAWLAAGNHQLKAQTMRLLATT